MDSIKQCNKKQQNKYNITSFILEGDFDDKFRIVIYISNDKTFFEYFLKTLG